MPKSPRVERDDSSWQAAEAITKMGRGQLPGRLEGVEYPPDYSRAGIVAIAALKHKARINGVELPALDLLSRS